MFLYVYLFEPMFTYFLYFPKFLNKSNLLKKPCVHHKVFVEEFVEKLILDVDDQEKIPDLGEALKER